MGGGGEASGNNAYPEHPPYSRHHAASSPFDQGHYGAPASGGYGYYNQGGSTPSYSGPDSRPYPAQSPSYQQHYSPAPSPAPYHYVTDQQQGPSASASQQQQQQPSHMSFSSQQSPAQGAYTPTPSVPAPSHYAPNHRHAGQHGYPAPAASQHQQWGNYGSSASPVMGSPSGQQQRSSNSQSPMSSQFAPQSPAQQQQQQPPPSSHWQSHGHSMHTNSNHNMVANMSPPPPSPLQSQAAAAAQYYQASPSTAQVACPPSSIPPPPRSNSGRTQAASPQQLDLSCPSPRQPVDLHSPGPTMASAGSWPARSTGGEGGSSPLASLQMLVNQDMNRQAAAAAAYPPNSQGMVDLSLPRGNTPHQKPEELRNGAASTTSSPPALNGDLSSSADSGISSPHLHPPDKPTGPRISVKSPQRLAAEADRRAQQRTTPSPQSPMVKPSESQSEPEGSPSPMPREARTKASMKRARKVDAILENLSGTKKKRPSSPPTPEAPPVVNIVPPSEDSGMEGSTSCPNSPNKAPRSEREDTVSPNFDDASQDNSKPRRKRKPDNPVRLKTTEEGKNSKGEASKSEPETTKTPTPVAVEAPVAPPSETPKEVPPPEPPKSDAVDLTVKPTAVSQTPEAKLDATISEVSSVVETPPSEPPSNPPPPPPPSVDPPTSSKPDIAQVETELAKMFEGIESEPLRPRANSLDETIDAVAKAGNDNNEPQPSTSAASSPSKSSPTKMGKRGRPKMTPDSSSEASPKKQKKNKDETPKKKRPKSKLSDDDDLFIPEAMPKKKKKKLDGKSPKVEEVKKKEASGSQAMSVERPRGPYVRIDGPRDSPIHVSVYNSTRGEDEDGERPSAACALKYNRKKLSWQNENDLRQRVQGLGFSSTMASHYDAFKLDESWRCAFCKRGSHSDGMGDLFGPYFIQQEADVLAMQQAEDAKKTKTKKKRRKSTEDPQKTSKKSKASGSGAQDNPVPGTWEVWVHEPCAVWAAGVHLVGPRMVGLQEAIWGATTSRGVTSSPTKQAST
ncbi:UNVERIFIED_CONTAM: hypothetical protein B566_EDAN016671 [Ephemera danica]|nr:hypothetical protein B566_EDAN016671 [Ephemera danica]